MKFGSSFNTVAHLYDEVRPSYPDELIGEITRYAALDKGSRILEVGVGTGQITLPFAKKGYDILGLEPGANLARVAKEKLASFSNINIAESTFEKFESAERFDLCLSAQAFHWIEPSFGVTRAAKLLKQKGTLALVWHIDRSASTDFYTYTTPIFEKYLPTDPKRSTPPASWKRYQQTIKESAQFTHLSRYAVDWTEHYSKDGFLKLLQTFSPIIMLSQKDREGFLLEMAEAIDVFGGSVSRVYETVVVLARKQVD